MTTQVLELHKMVDSLPADLVGQATELLRNLKKSYTEIPASLIIDSREELEKSLEQSEKEIEQGEVFPADEVYMEMRGLLKTMR